MYKKMKQTETIETPITTNQTLSENTEQWDLIIKPQSSLLDIPWADIWRYRDLLVMFVKRDVITVYKQTVLGPDLVCGTTNFNYSYLHCGLREHC